MARDRKTTTVRVPEAGAEVACGLVEIALAEATEELMRTKWYMSSRSTEIPKVRMLRIETRMVNTSIGGIHSGQFPMPFLICEAQVNEYVGTFAVRVDFGRGGVEIEDERYAEG
ncbi:hypothetical protein [Methylocaldum gracile]|jgi:hypothetical protein